MKKVSIVLIILVSMFILFLCNGWHIEFNEDKVVSGNIEFGEEIRIFKGDARLKGKFLFKEKGIPLFSDLEHNVDKKELGTYQITYSADFLFWENTLQTSVSIIDTTPPEITLHTIKYNYTSPNEKYEEEGYSAYDRYDDDLTDKVTSYEENGKVYYSVMDSSGNIGTAVREIQYKDERSPRITLKGETLINIRQYETFVEPGFTAEDDCDGDVTSNVKVTDNLNIMVPGKYEIKYYVEDSWGNHFETTRTIVVNEIIEPENKEPIEETETFPENTTESENTENTETSENQENTSENTSDNQESNPETTTENSTTTEPPKEEVTTPVEPAPEKVIYLTFDDGPSKYTRELLEILRANNVKATFFVVGSRYSDVISEIYADGHAIGAHSYTHEYKDIYASVDAYFNDLEKIRNVIYEKTGYYTNLVRFPGGSSNSVSKFNPGIMTTLSKELANRGYVYFDWNVSSGDAGSTTITNEVYNNVIKGIGSKKNAIVLQHDTYKYSIDAVQDIINWGKENGYVFKTLNENSPTSHHKIYN